LCAPAHIKAGSANPTWEEIMGRLILESDGITYPLIGLLGESSLGVILDDTGTGGLIVDFLVLEGTTSVAIASRGATGGYNALHQLAEIPNDLATVTIKGSEPFFLGSAAGVSNTGDGVVTDIAATATSPTKIHSSLTLIDASATTGRVDILAGATNTSGGGNFENGGSLNANVSITYTGLTIKGGSGLDFIENDAKNGIVTDGNSNDDIVILGGAGAKAVLGTGTSDRVFVGVSDLGTNEAAGNALGDKVTFGSAATAELLVRTGAEAGSTAGTASIGLTKVVNAADGMEIDFTPVTGSHFIADETTVVASATTLKAAENAAVNAFGGSGVAYFSFHGNEYFIATANVETVVSSHDAIVELVGVTDIHHAANNFGLVTLHV
jgi:hypothetical protein